MAATYTPITAFDYAKIFLKRMPLQDISVTILDRINKMIWMRAPWRWTLGSLVTTTLVSSTQDYATAQVADFLFALDAQLNETGTAQDTTPRDLHVEAALPTSVGIIGQPSKVLITSTLTRVSPVPATLPAGKTFVISGLYKKIAPVLTESNIFTAGALVMDDEWNWVYEAGVLWLAYLYGDDQRAGSVQVANGNVQYSGQRAVFEAAMLSMESQEKLPIFNRRHTQEQESRGK